MTAPANPERVDILVIGTGFAGLCTAIKLKEAGMDDFVVVEQDDGVGGTWRVNRYPGAQCDVPSLLYSFSFAPNPAWSRTFPLQPELLAYLEGCVDRWGLAGHLRFGVRVTGMTWDDRTSTWEVRAADGRRWRARVVVSGTGGLSRPALPAIEGAGTFAGPAFHSARWDDRVDLTGKRVAVIGTGASAIQVVPNIVDQVDQLVLFQRTPPWIIPHTDRPVGAVERAIYRRLPIVQRAVRAAIYWRLELRATAFVLEPRLLELAERQVRRFLAASVPDPVLRAKLTPSYRMGCKRVLISDAYYPAVQRDHVEVVTDRIRAITPRGVVTADGTEREVDVIIYCTGFQAAEDVAPFDVRGAGGRSLAEAWQGGAEAYLGTAIAGFPNFFMIVGPNTGLGHSSMVFMIESQVAYVMDALRRMKQERWSSVEVRADVQDRFNHQVQAKLGRTVWQTGGCTSWYQTATGRNTTLWPGFTAEFRWRTRRFDASCYSVRSEASRAAAASMRGVVRAAG